MTLPAPTVVIFDMDGTTVRHLNPRLLHLLEWLDDASHKCAKLFSRIFRRNIESPILVEFHEGKRKKLLVHRALHKFRRKEVDQIVEPCPGIYAMLDFLRAHNIPLGLASNGLGKGYGHDVLKTFELGRYFSATLFREDFTKSKPNPEPLLMTLKAMGVKLKSHDIVWYIGDRHKDVTAALAAAQHLPCPMVPIAYGLNASVAVLEKNVGPDHIIMSYHDMLKKLERLMGKPSKAAVVNGEA